MNLFEKIFNYQIISRLDDTGTFMVTAHERSWLKAMLQHPVASDAFTPETMDKLKSMLTKDEQMETSAHLIEKARSREKQVYHPLLRPLRRLIMNRSGIRITHCLRSGKVYSNQLGVPYRLEYSMVKREWYLLWHHVRNRAFMSTKLDKIISVTEEALPIERVNGILERIGQTLDNRKTEVLIEIIPHYNPELSRILYALSCFEKEVQYDAQQDTYTVEVCLLGEEKEYLLSKLRFLGKRVRVLEGNYVKKRMLEASTKALERYGVLGEDNL
ncbi:WYL domain-containing protein [Paenibacillus sp. KQZ6P-2]|uniref:WYL domain-containing protein n=1 Tax=Paenibacillus mangrovi TaxID=2931978 RepID=A0A9X1WR91_9BACL|nr:WYL domain-containing protein [Paenibacillus mangrovi]MCJ8012193.1 WYL domain-containing protein [Paenibacillus mangrovi]